MRFKDSLTSPLVLSIPKHVDDRIFQQLRPETISLRMQRVSSGATCHSSVVMLIDGSQGRCSLLGVEPRPFIPPIALTWYPHWNWYNFLEHVERVRILSIRWRPSLVGLVFNNRKDHTTFPIATVQFRSLGRSVSDKPSPASQ